MSEIAPSAGGNTAAMGLIWFTATLIRPRHQRTLPDQLRNFAIQRRIRDRAASQALKRVAARNHARPAGRLELGGRGRCRPPSVRTPSGASPSLAFCPGKSFSMT